MSKIQEMEDLDYFVLRNVEVAREGSTNAKKILKEKILSLFDKPKTKTQEVENIKLVDFILEKLIDEYYCERNLESNYEDNNLAYIARCIPALKRNGSRFYSSGDTHFFYRLDDRNYVFGRMDGQNHGFEAALIVLTARRYLDEIINKGIIHSKDIAESLAEKLETIPRRVSFTTMFMSVLDDKEILLTNVRDGETWVYSPISDSVRLCPPYGLVLGAGDANLRAKFPYVEEKEIVQKGYTIVSYTDGLCGRVGFDQEKVKSLVGSKQTLKTMVNKILQYSDSLIPIESDDVTLIAVRLK